MALLFTEGFEQYVPDNDFVSNLTLTSMPGRWSAGNGFYAGNKNTGRTAGPNGVSACGYPQWSVTTAWASVAIPATNEVIVGFGLRPADTFGNNHAVVYLSNVDGFPSAGLRLVILAGGILQIESYTGGTWNIRLTTAASQIVAATWSYIELKVLHGAGTGSINLRIDGNLVGSIADVDTAGGLAAGYSRVTFGHTQGQAPYKAAAFDDIYICDTTPASKNNDFLGAVSVYTLFPDGDAAIEFGPSTAGSNFSCVNKTIPNTTPYVKTTAANKTDWYTLQNLPSTPQFIRAIAVNNRSRKADNGPRKIVNQIRLGATPGTVATDTNVTTPLFNNPRLTQTLFESQPDGTTDWNTTAINDLQVGIESR